MTVWNQNLYRCNKLDEKQFLNIEIYLNMFNRAVIWSLFAVLPPTFDSYLLPLGYKSPLKSPPQPPVYRSFIPLLCLGM